MDKPLVSIIMPFKNAAPFLDDCMHSIINQTYKNWELFAVNDHSTDHSEALLKSYTDDRIHLLQNTGSGIIDALKTGYRSCKGDLITRMDADDVMPDIKIESLVEELLEKGKNHIATGRVSYFSESVLGDGYKKYEEWLNRLTDNNSNFTEIYKECSVASPCWMVWREDFEQCNGFNNDTYPEDYDLLFRFYQNKLKITGVTKTLHLWRDSPDRTSRTDEKYKDNRFLAIKTSYFLEIDYDQNKNLVVWGAGKKGKEIAKHFIARNIPFNWICNSPSKIGKDIYGIILENCYNYHFNNSQVIIAVANEEEQKEIEVLLKANNQSDYFYFC